MDKAISTNIVKQLKFLEDAFYDGIDARLLNHPDLNNFEIQMHTIINKIKNLLEPSLPPVSNINYSQLDMLGKSLENNIKN
jgi:hypothetical protein